MKKKNKIKSKVISMRLPPWVDFRIRKLADFQNQSIPVTVSAAIRVYISELKIPECTIQKWLQEYHKENPDGLD